MKKQEKSLVFKNVEEALSELRGQDRGSYFICECPECKRNEAFIYKNNVNVVNCSRDNECGERVFIEYKEVKSVREVELEAVKKKYPKFTSKQAEAMDWAVRAYEHIQNYFPSKALDNGYRGLSKSVTKEFVVDLREKQMVSFMFKKIEPLLSKDYSKSSFMNQRNLVFPIYSDDGMLDRIILRSTLNPDIKPKEIQLITNKSRDARDFIVDIPVESDTVIISEALLDGLSFREIDESVGLIALSGTKKTARISSYLKDNKDLFKDKHILVAMDNDRAGIEATRKIINVLKYEDIGKSSKSFEYPEAVGISDPNEFLQANKDMFIKCYERNLFSLKKSEIVNNGTKILLTSMQRD